MIDHKESTIKWITWFLFIEAPLMMMTYPTYQIYSRIPYIFTMAIMMIFIWLRAKNMGKRLVFYIFAGSYLIINTLFNRGGLGGIFVQAFIFTSAEFYSRITMGKQQIKYTTVLFTILLIVISIKSKGYYDIAAAVESGEVINSNTVAEISFILYAFLCIIVKHYFKKLYQKIIIKNVIIRINLFYVMIGLLSIYIIQQCKARAALVVWLFFTFLFFFCPKKFLNEKNISVLTILIVVLGAAYPFVFLKLQEYPNVNYWIYNVTGRYMYTGREKIWTTYINEVGDSFSAWMFGLGSHSTVGISTQWGSNLHNSYWGIIFNFGIVGLTLYLLLIMMFKKNRRKDDLVQNEISRDFFLLFDAILLFGWTETILIWSSMIPFCYAALGFSQNKSLK